MRAIAGSTLVLLAIATTLAAGKAVNFRGSGHVPRTLVKDILRQETADHDHHLSKFEDALRYMYASLPKNQYGNLDHQTVRYALHRYYVDQHGWYIAGMEPTIVANTSELPGALQDSFESQLGSRGVDLNGLATLAASMEDIAREELRVRLRDAFEAEDVDMNVQTIRHDSASLVLETFLISFLLSNNWTITGAVDLNFKKSIFHTKYKGYDATMAWYQPIRDRHLGISSRDVPFGDMAEAAMEISKTYHSYNDNDCNELKGTLKDMESRRPGRVRLSTFYNMSLYSHWAFTEKVDFLRALGALDESDPKQVAVIIPNYALSRLNCLNATRTFAICCRNTCDDLTKHLEKEIGGPAATAEHIIDLVANLPSDSVAAPRKVPAALVTRLEEVSAHHNGKVPLHGRLFSQWMHHAYPLECPYPQEVGYASVLTAEEWIARTGASQEASPEDIKRLVEADTCAADGQACGDDAELPWSMTEELLAAQLGEQPGAGGTAFRDQIISFAFLVAASGLAWPLAYAIRDPKLDVAIARSGSQQSRVMIISILLASAAFFANLLDGLIFGIALGGSCSYVGAKLVATRFGININRTGKAKCSKVDSDSSFIHGQAKCV